MLVVWTNPKGILHVEVPANKFIAEIENAAARLGESFTPAQLAVVACGKAVTNKNGIDPLICDEADIPTDRTFRNAWERDGARPVKVNMDKALVIAQNQIRAERAPMLAALDVEFTRAQGKKDQAAADAVEAERQKLRDATEDSNLLSAADPDALKSAMQAVVAGMKAK